MGVPRYYLPDFPKFILGNRQVDMRKIISFLRYIVQRNQLGISDYLRHMGEDPFFLVAATGLGKTVAVPVHLLIRVMESVGQLEDPEPRVWVVEPRIPIAIDQMRFMNSLWQEFLHSSGERHKFGPLFGCISSAFTANYNAPIMFITTGIFELKAKNNELTAGYDRVIIDEAHVTIEQNSGVELGMCLARAAGVTVDYMSATVDTANISDDLGVENIIVADAQRYPVWKHNLGQPLDDALVPLVRDTLVAPKRNGEFFPSSRSYAHAKQVREAVLAANTAHGMLVVVNSFAGDQSDIRRLADKLRKAFPSLPVLELASEVVRNPAKLSQFQHRLVQAEKQRQHYVILATSVVEMGITFPSLGYVVTMDAGYVQETVGDTTFPTVGPLGINALLQRIGRVGRRRAGIAYISNEVGAAYATLNDHQLNNQQLQYEPIRFPLANAPLLQLAYYACAQQQAGDLQKWLTELAPPSRIDEDPDRMAQLTDQVEILHRLEVAENGRLTLLGERMEPWVGQADLIYAMQLQRRLEEGCCLEEMMFWLVATALSKVPLVSLRAKYGYFIDYESSNGELAHQINVWQKCDHEDLAAYSLIRLTVDLFPNIVFSNVYNKWDADEFESWCLSVGLDARKMLQAFHLIKDAWKLLRKANKQKGFDFFQNTDSLPLNWGNTLTVSQMNILHQELIKLPNVDEVRIKEGDSGYFWSSIVNTSYEAIDQNDTPVKLDPSRSYTARVFFAPDNEAGSFVWRLAHLSIVPPHSVDAEDATHDNLFSTLLERMMFWRN